MNDLAGRTAIVVGASRGLGRGMATALAEAGANVVAVSRGPAAFPQLAPGAGAIQQELADAAVGSVPASLLDRYEPDVIVLAAGAKPHMCRLQDQTWETFSVNWQTDVRIAFNWLREALLKPLRPGSRVVVVGSGAALNTAGSPLSGGYAGAKATQRFITGYAQGEANRSGLAITFTTVMSRMWTTTAVGQAGALAYAARAGLSLEAFLEQSGQILTPESAGMSLVELLRIDAAALAPAYLLTGAGLEKLS